jgi:zeta-carotene desaturase
MTPDAIVIGAGFAGLSAATMLAEHGRRVLVLEARPAPGGRASAFTDPATGERVDNGQHIFFGCYRETFRLLRRLGTEADLRLQPRLAVTIVDEHATASDLSCPTLPSPFHLLTGVLRWDALGWRDRLAVLRLGPALVALRSRTTPDAGEETVRQWLLRHGQTSRLIELLWQPLAVAALNQPIDVASARAFEQVLKGLFGRRTRDAALAVPQKPLDELYARPAESYLEKRRGAVRCQSPAQVRCAPRLSVVTARGDELTAPAVICAVPWYALQDAFPDRPPALAAVLDAAARTDASPIVTVNLWLDRAVTEHPFVGLPGRAMQWVFDKRELFGERASHLSLVSSGADTLVGRTNDELVELAVSELRTALPAACAAELRRAVVVRERRATFSVAPGQPPRPGARTAVPGLFLAGDWIETGLPATIEGAVRSGHAAAAAVLES